MAEINLPDPGLSDAVQGRIAAVKEGQPTRAVMTAAQAADHLPPMVTMSGHLDFPAPADVPHRTIVHDIDAAGESWDATEAARPELPADHPAVHRQGAMSFLARIGIHKHT